MLQCFVFIRAASNYFIIDSCDLIILFMVIWFIK